MKDLFFESGERSISSSFREIIERDGENVVSNRILEDGERFSQLLDCILYGSNERGDLEREFVEMATILYGRSLTVDEIVILLQIVGLKQ